MYVIKASDGTLYGPFGSKEDADAWASLNEDDLGDWCMEYVYGTQ